MSVRDECIAALTALSCPVNEGHAMITIGLPNLRIIGMEHWRFNLLCARVHDATPHECQRAA